MSISLFLENEPLGVGLFYGTAFLGSVAILVGYLSFHPASTICNIAGPRTPTWLFGTMIELQLPATYGDFEFTWQKFYGPIYKVMGCYGQERLMVSDPVALQHILNSPHFPLSPDAENRTHLLFGKKSMMGANERDHKRLRAPFNAGFTASAVRSYMPVLEKAAQTLVEQIEESSAAWINSCPLLSIATLSTVSEVVLGYSTEHLGEEFMFNNFQIMALASGQSPLQILSAATVARLPGWLMRATIYLPTRNFKAIRTAKYLADGVGRQVIRENQDAARQGLDIHTDLYGQLGKVITCMKLSSLTPRDSVEQHASGQTKNTLAEDDLVNQTAIILIAGQDTTANTVAFGLLELAKAPQLQDQLRTEIMSSSRAGGIAYDSMPLLNAFIKECLRMYPTEAITERSAAQDTVIPLSARITTVTGESLAQIPVRKGQVLMLALASYQRLESHWGADAMEFKPARWLDGMAYKGEAVGLYANLILEMQVFLCELVGKFVFTLPAEQPARTRFTTTLLPAMLNGQKGAPLCIERIV
ncbi:cytochrome P450 [Mycena polygramma]|nr:cytochrome P450 [Mycena polygramma]